jgi:hypothetical protein
MLTVKSLYEPRHVIPFVGSLTEEKAHVWPEVESSTFLMKTHPRSRSGWNDVLDNTGDSVWGRGFHKTDISLYQANM